MPPKSEHYARRAALSAGAVRHLRGIGAAALLDRHLWRIGVSDRRRVPEFGIRIALGASARDVVRLVMRQSLGMILVGAALGVAVSFAAARLLARLVAGTEATDPLTFAVMILVLIAAALFASFVPARRASRVDPMSALRQE